MIPRCSNSSSHTWEHRIHLNDEALRWTIPAHVLDEALSAVAYHGPRDTRLLSAARQNRLENDAIHSV